MLLLRFVESHGAHENGPQASVCGAIRFKSRRRREAGERNPRVFEFRYEVIAKIITLCTCICITIHSRVQRRIILPSKFFFIIVHDDIVAISSITTFNDSSCTGAGLGVLGSQTGGPQNLQQPPMCPSPSAHSDSSSGNGRLSSAGSEPGTLRSCSSSTCKWSSGIIVSVS